MSKISHSEEIVFSLRQLLTLPMPMWLVDQVIKAWCALICDVEPAFYALRPMIFLTWSDMDSWLSPIIRPHKQYGPFPRGRPSIPTTPDVVSSSR